MAVGRVPGLVLGQLGSTFNTYLARGLAFSGINNDAAYWWDDFTQGNTQAAPNQYASYATNGTHDIQVAGMAGGICREATTGTANSQVGFNGFGTIATDIKAGKSYIAFRMAVSTAIDAQANAAMGWYNQAASISVMAGVFGAQSTANFTLQFDGDRGGSFVNFATAIDTAFHIYEIYGTGNNIIKARMDGGAEISATLTLATTSTHFFTNLKNGTTAANRQMDIDWVLAMGARL